MPATDSGLRRVAVHAEGASADLTLPATVPVAELIPSIVDTMGAATPGARYRLARLGAAALPNSTTLTQNGIRDGAALILSRETLAPPAIRFDDDAEAVSAMLGSPASSGRLSRTTAAVAAVCFTAVAALALVRYACVASRPVDAAAAAAALAAMAALTTAVVILRIRRDPIAGLTLGLIATTSAAAAGLLVVPGTPRAPHVLLAAMAAAVTAVLAVRVTRCGVIILSATACGAAVIAAATLARVTIGAPPHVIGAVTALACLGLIELAPRLSIRLGGLAPSIDQECPPHDTELTANALYADRWLTILRTGFAGAAAIDAVAAAIAAHRAIALAVITGSLLIAHARIDRARASLFTVTGITTIATAFVIGIAGLPRQALWIAALAAAAAVAALYLGFLAPAITLSPVARRGVHALGCIAFTVVAPLTCWTCGAFGAVRGLNLIRT